MKKILSLALFIAIAVGCFSSEPLEPIPLSLPDGPIVNDGSGGHRSPAYPDECPIKLYVDWDEMILQVVGISDSDVVSFLICDSDDDVVLFGNLSQTISSIDISSLIAGTYHIEITFNGINYIGQIEIE